MQLFLNPADKSKLKGRSEFFIHGGEMPGSKGCVDLTDQNEDFHVFMRLYKRNMKVIVRY